MTDSHVTAGVPTLPAPPTPGKRTNGPGIAALIIGIVALVGSFIPFVNYATIPLAIVGIVLGIVGLVIKGRGRGTAIGGLIASGVALIASIILAIVYTLAAAAAVASLDLSTIDSGSSGTDSSEILPAGGSAKYGATFSYKDGVAVSVSKPTTFTPSVDAGGADQAAAVQYTVTITNGSKTALDAFATWTGKSKGVDATPIEDSDNGLDVFAGQDTLAPGQSESFTIGLSVADPSDVSVAFSPAFGYQDVVFSAK